MVGLELPILAMEHQYLITGDMPELAGKKEQLHCIDFEGEIYMRQERGGMLMGTYERAGVPWSPVTTPWDFGQDLLPNDLERIAPSLEVGFEHFPALGQAGIKKVVNGPFTFAPDGNPLVGPIKGLKNFWVACGVMAGFSQGGGVGLGAVALDGRTAIRAPTSGAWTSRATAIGPRSPTPMPRCARIIRAASASAFRTRSCRPRGRCAPRRSTRSSRRSMRCSAITARWSIRCGSRPRAAEAEDRGQLPALELLIRTSAAECRAVQRRGRSAGDLQLRQVRGARARARPNGCRASWPTACPPSAGSRLTPMLNERGKLIGDFTMCRVVAGSLLPGRHLCGGNLLHALVRAAPAAARRFGAAVRDGVHRAVGGGAEVARAAAKPGAR